MWTVVDPFSKPGAVVVLRKERVLVSYLKRARFVWMTLAALSLVVACSAGSNGAGSADEAEPTKAESGQAVAVFAGGCFWCMEPPFDNLTGVISTTSGYAGGKSRNPTYKQVTAGGTGHLEVVQVIYDPTQVSFTELVDVFWRNVDPFDVGGQFCDRGESYTTAIFVAESGEQEIAQSTKRLLAERFESPIATKVLPLAANGFYPAEDYHQNYYLKNPLRYKYYRTSCGRDRRLREVWGEPTG